MPDIIVLDLNKLKDGIAQENLAPGIPMVGVFRNAREEIVVGNLFLSAEEAETHKNDRNNYGLNGPKVSDIPLFYMTAEQVRKAPAINNDLLISRARYLYSIGNYAPVKKARLTQIITTTARKRKRKSIREPGSKKPSVPANTPLPSTPPVSSASGVEYVLFNRATYRNYKSTKTALANPVNTIIAGAYKTKDGRIVAGTGTAAENSTRINRKHTENRGTLHSKLFDISLQLVNDYKIIHDRKLDHLIQYLCQDSEIEKSPDGFRKYLLQRLPSKTPQKKKPVVKDPKGRVIVFNQLTYKERRRNARVYRKPETDLLMVYRTTKDEIVYGTDCYLENNKKLQSVHAERRGIVAEELFNLSAKDITKYAIDRIRKIDQLIQYFIETPTEKRVPKNFFMRCDEHTYSGYNKPAGQ